MANTKTSALTALTGAGVATGDLFPIDDVSATLLKSITMAELLNAISALLPITAFAKTLLDDADNTAARTTLGLGTGATATIANYLPLLAGGAAVENIGSIESNVNTVAATGSTETLDLAVYGVHDCTMDQNCTFTFSNPAPSGKNTTFVLVLRGAFVATLPSSVKWSTGTVPTYTTPSFYLFSTIDGGTNYFAQQVGRAFA
jgi:hypothetical protein